MDPPPRELSHEQPHPLDDELYQPMSGDENMEETEDMDARSVGLIPMQLDRCQQKLVERYDREILVAVRSLGESRKAHKRERKVALNRIMSEVYSPPRVAAAAKLLSSLKILLGASLVPAVNQQDGTPWGFDIKVNREKA